MIKRYNKYQIKELSTILKNDGVISVPTDTVYGLCAKIYSKKAYNKLITIKNRPLEKSFPIMCSDIDQIKEIAVINNVAKVLIDKFMPGPITLILNKLNTLPDYITNGKKTIAVRMASSEELITLIKKTGCPLFMTSANISGNPTCKTLDEIEYHCPLLDGMLEGNVVFSKSSTIVDCTTLNIIVLREGPILEKDLYMALS